MQRLLPVISHGPTIFYMVYYRCTRMGPLENIEPAADDFIWAHYFSYGVPQMYWDGPINIRKGCCRWFGMGQLFFTRHTADVLGWAHYFSYGVPPMHQGGPIISHVGYHRCIGMGPLAYAKAAAGGLAWANYFLQGVLLTY